MNAIQTAITLGVLSPVITSLGVGLTFGIGPALMTLGLWLVVYAIYILRRIG